MEFESWLDPEDVDRLWRVVHGELPEVAATSDELVEFERLVVHAAMLKVAGPDYRQYNIQ